MRNNFTDIIHYCCGSYDTGCFGGVPRYDYHIKLAFPNRIFFQGPTEKVKMLDFLSKCQNPLIITDNHLSCDIPNKYKILLVHHGIAETHYQREPTWNVYWRKLCCDGQNRMLEYRDPITTKIVNISQFCKDEFFRIYGGKYLKFNIIDMLHTSELDINKYKSTFNTTLHILGAWGCKNKGPSELIEKLKINNQNFKFNQLKVGYNYNKNPLICQEGIDDYNKRKQDIYLNNDIYLCLSLSEGSSYAMLDALLSGLVIVSTDVGLAYKDIPEDCFVKLDWKKRDDINYVSSKLNYAWENKEQLSKKSREWFVNNCSFDLWKSKIRHLVYHDEF